MIRFISKFKVIYFLSYTLILYIFFVTLYSKEYIFRRNSSFDDTQKQLLNSISTIEEKKFLLDFKYKTQVNPSLRNNFRENLVFLDAEYRIIGYKSVSYQGQLSSRFSVYLNKKFLHSFLFGSIKFIKI